MTMTMMVFEHEGRGVPVMQVSHIFAKSDDDSALKPKSSGTVQLPPVFSTPFRPDLIHKAYVHLESHSYQPQGRYPMAGMNVVADTNDPPTGRGIARIARAEGGGGRRRGEGAEVASTRGGRQAHPPKSEKRIYKKLNKKENRLALCSAIAATASADLIASRGHRISEYVQVHGDTFPIIADDGISKCTTTQHVTKLLDSLGLSEDVSRLINRKARSGLPSLRGRSKKTGKSILFVTHAKNEPLHRAVGSLPGVDAKCADNLSVLDLAPGGKSARLVVFTQTAMAQLSQIMSRHLSVVAADHQSATSPAEANA